MVQSLAEARSHNVPAEVFLRHWREIRDAKKVKDEGGMGHTRAKKAAKNAGINLDALKLVEQFSELDTDEMELLLKDVIAYAKWLKLPVGTQMEMFAKPDVAMPSAEAQERHEEWEAGQDGLAAGGSGELRDANPHEPGSAKHASWDRQWAKGNKVWLREQNERADDLGENAGVPRRGRRRSQAPEGNGAAAGHA